MGIRVGESGFTIVEVIITLTLAALFLAFFVQMFESIAAQQFSTARQATANDIAFSNLSKFPDSNAIKTATGEDYVCDVNSNDLTSSSSAPGTLILDNSSEYRETELRGLPQPTQEVRAYSPHGCDDSSLIKIESRVSYGFTSTQGEAIYATYIR